MLCVPSWCESYFQCLAVWSVAAPAGRETVVKTVHSFLAHPLFSCHLFHCYLMAHSTFFVRCRADSGHVIQVVEWREYSGEASFLLVSVVPGFSSGNRNVYLSICVCFFWFFFGRGWWITCVWRRINPLTQPRSLLLFWAEARGQLISSMIPCQRNTDMFIVVKIQEAEEGLHFSDFVYV